MGVYMVERYAAGLDAPGVRRMGRLAARGGSVRYLGSALVPGDGASLCFFESASAPEVERAARGAGGPVDRVVEVERVAAEGAP